MASIKGQMFIVTMVFFIALIFSVQQLLLQYAAIDLSTPPQATDAYLVENMEPIFQAALDSSDDCEEARANVRELKNLITRTIKGGYSVDISGDIACSPDWPSAPQLTILVTVTGETSETQSSLELYHVYHDCTPDCAGKECGPDGCGGSCGLCGSHASCSSGTCVCDAGWDDCDGDDACECDLSSSSCFGGSCVVSCTPTCYTQPGCRASLENGHTVPGDCCGSGDCYECDTGYSWDGGSCVGHWFLLTNSTSNADLGGMSGANAICLNEVNSYEWKNKPAGVTYDQSQVRAFICDSTTCNNLLPDTKYAFGVLRDSYIGGDSFVTDSSGRGPGDNDIWQDDSKFGAKTIKSYWSNRYTGFSDMWPTTPDPIHEACGDWTSSDYYQGANNWVGLFGAISVYGDESRWRFWQSQPCDSQRHLVCFVNYLGCTPTCYTQPGCRTSLENGHAVPGDCCSAGDCYECDAGSSWNGDECECDAGSSWNGDECERIWAPETVSCDYWTCMTDITQADTRWAVGSAAESPDIPTIDEQSGDVTYPSGYTADDFPAFKFCEEATYDGYTNWRLPTMDELRSIHTDSYTNPNSAYSTLDQIYRLGYWSSEQGTGYGSNQVAQYTNFMNSGPPGGEGQAGKAYCCHYLICTRSMT